MAITPKEAVRARLKQRGLTQAQLADVLGTTPAILSRTLGSPLVRPDSHWPAVLAELGLRLAVVPLEIDLEADTPAEELEAWRQAFETRSPEPTTPGDPRGYLALVGLFGAEDGPTDVSTDHDAHLGRAAEEEYQTQTGGKR